MSKSHRLKNLWFESNWIQITRPVAAIKSLRFALFVPKGPIQNKSILSQVKACAKQMASYYMNQYWLIFLYNMASLNHKIWSKYLLFGIW